MKAMPSKCGCKFENLASMDKITTMDTPPEYKRAARFSPADLRKLSPAYRVRKYQSKRRTLAVALGFRDLGKQHHIQAYSMSVLEGLLTDNELDVLPEWRYADKTKTVMMQLAMGLIEAEQERDNSPDRDRLQLIPFVFNLSERFQQRIHESKRNEVAACMAILSRDLKRALKRNVDLWFQLEMAPKGGKGKPHIQGAILLSQSEFQKARDVFHRANGPVSLGFKNHAIRFCTNSRRETAEKSGLLYADINWSLYCAKEHARTKILYADQDKPMLTNVIAVSNNIHKAAKRLYEGLRNKQLD